VVAAILAIDVRVIARLLVQGEAVATAFAAVQFDAHRRAIRSMVGDVQIARLRAAREASACSCTDRYDRRMRVMLNVRAACLLCLFSAVGTAAPFQSAKTITGAPFTSNGEPTIVHYWATWCVPCRIEMPVLDAYYRKHHAQGLAMLAISIDQGASTAKLQQVTGKFAFPIARLDDVKMPRREIPTALPVTRVYDRSGRLVFATKGDGRTTVDMATLERVVTPLLTRS
jgi:thiol-disulfide isomerase/thioredoxin